MPRNRKLRLSKETMTELTGTELAVVVGADTGWTYSCVSACGVVYSGCICSVGANCTHTCNCVPQILDSLLCPV